MSDNIVISLINKRGRVVWIDEHKVPEFIDKGWRHITNPKETYYPQYDTTLQEVKPDEIGGKTRVLEGTNDSSRLGIITF